MPGDCHRAVEKALAGSDAANHEIINRTEGKAIQPVEVPDGVNVQINADGVAKAALEAIKAQKETLGDSDKG